MSVSFYMDVHVRRAVTEGLRLRSVDVLTAQEDGTTLLEDSELLNRATTLGRVLFTQDKDFLSEGIERQQNNHFFAGIVFAHQLDVTIGQCVSDLEIVSKAGEPEDLENRILYLPL